MSRTYLAEKGISVSYESIRLWCIKFGPAYARKLKQMHGGFGDTFYLDEVLIKINSTTCGEQSIRMEKLSRKLLGYSVHYAYRTSD